MPRQKPTAARSPRRGTRAPSSPEIAQPAPVGEARLAVLPDKYATRIAEHVTRAEIEGRILAGLPHAAEKTGLPLIVCGTLDGSKTKNRSVRHDAGLETLVCVLGDHDTGTVGIPDAANRFKAAGVQALFYTSPRHTPEQPRWRVICWTARTYTRGSDDLAAVHRTLTDRMHAILGEGVITGECWTLSQSYYFGSVDPTREHYETRAVSGAGIDAVDIVGLPKPGTKTKGNGADTSGEPFADIEHGVAIHPAQLDIAKDLASRGVARDTIVAALKNALKASDAPHDERWATRLADCDRIADWALNLYGGVGMTDAQRALFADIAERFTPPPTEDEDAASEHFAAAIRHIALEDEALYGPLRGIVDAACANSEATRPGVAVATLAQFAVHCTAPFYIRLGDDKAPVTIFAGIIGTSAKARKGTSDAYPSERLFPALRDLAKEAYGRRARALEKSGAQRSEHALRALALETAFTDMEALKNCTVESETARLKDAEERVKRVGANLEGSKAKLTTLEGGSPVKARNATNAVAFGEGALLDAKAQVEVCKRRLKLITEGDKKKLADEITRLKAAVTKDESAPVEEVGKFPLADLVRDPHVMRGASTGEGIIARIADPMTYEDGSELAGSDDKRLLLNIHEGGGLFARFARADNTLSMTLRDAYDARALETNAKTRPVTCMTPHVSMVFHITIAEFVARMFDDERSTEADNGMGNRPLYVFVGRTKLVALPQPVPEPTMLEHASLLYANTGKVYAAHGVASPVHEYLMHEVKLTPEAEALWRENYAEVTQAKGASAYATSLLARLETNLRRLAALLALINGETRVSEGAMRAALAWGRYIAQSIDRIAATSIEDRVATITLGVNAVDVLAFIKEQGGRVTMRDLVRKLQHRHKGDAVRAAVRAMAEASPPLVRADRTQPDGGGTPTHWISVTTDVTTALVTSISRLKVTPSEAGQRRRRQRERGKA